MWPHEFRVLWSLAYWGGHPRYAYEIAALHEPPRTAQAMAPTLSSLAARGLLSYRQMGARRQWMLTDRAWELLRS